MKCDMRPFKCKDCRTCTFKAGEYYMVQDGVWSTALPDGRSRRAMLCIGCLEARLGRDLVGADFTEAPINRTPFLDHSARLSSRIMAGTNLRIVRRTHV